MQILKKITLMLFVCGILLFITNCAGGDANSDAASTEVAHAHGEGTEYNSAYVCPMHCEGSGSDAEGTCPVCSMAYVAQAAHAEDGHTH